MHREPQRGREADIPTQEGALTRLKRNLAGKTAEIDHPLCCEVLGKVFDVFSCDYKVAEEVRLERAWNNEKPPPEALSGFGCLLCRASHRAGVPQSSCGIPPPRGEGSIRERQNQQPSGPARPEDRSS